MEPHAAKVTASRLCDVHGTHNIQYSASTTEDLFHSSWFWKRKKKTPQIFFFLSHQCAVHSPVCKIQVFHFDNVCASKLLSAGGSSVQPQASVALFCLYNCKYTVPLYQKFLGI